MALALLVVAVAGLAIVLRGHAAPVHCAAARRGELVVGVLCDGNLVPPLGGELRTSEPGVVAQLLARDGTTVSPGQLLIRLDNPELAAQARAAHAEADRLSASLAAAQVEVDAAAKEATYRRSIVATDERLLADKAIPRATLDADRSASQAADDRQLHAQTEVNGLGGTGGTSQLTLARTDAVALDRRLAGLSLRAPAAGVVSGLPRTLGEAVTAGQLLGQVTDPDHPQVRFRIDQPDLPRVSAGQTLSVTFNGLPDRHWAGQVRSVGRGLREVGGRQVGEAVGDLSSPTRELPANAAVDVQVVVARREQVLIVPRAALRRDCEARYVVRVTDGIAHRCPVGVGLIGLSEVEIRTGLADGDQVVVEGPLGLAEGDRVALVKP
jgi:HlyD family secretion protein